MKAAAFGRRVVARHTLQHAAKAADDLSSEPEAVAEIQALAGTLIFPLEEQEISPEEELQAWKRERRRERLSRFPWRQLSIMAGLCFGIAGFVLPDTVNDAVSWLLYGMMAASLAFGFARRRAGS